MKNKGVDASQIAQLAGVSRATVSRVINNYQFVKPATRERVLKVIEEYSYTPNISAQVLAGKHHHTIGLFFVSDDQSQESRLEDIHANSMIERVIQTAASRGYYVLAYMINNVDDSIEQQRIKDMFNQFRIDAGIFIGFPNYYPPIEELIERDYVIGLFDQYIPGKDEKNRIMVGLSPDSTALVVDYAASLGHRDIMMINGDMRKPSGADKAQSFLIGMERNRLAVRQEWVLHGGRFTRECAYAVLSSFLDSGYPMPTCICCANDIMAFGAIEILTQRGIRVPDDVS
ncbi:MAG: LacI family DNA-binding transcriptional regulator, partial [Acetanaerobacterium sp.]